MNLRPLGDRIIVSRLKEESVSEGGIVLPDSAKEKPSRGEVVAVGNGVLSDHAVLRPLAVKVGDNVLFGKYSGTEIEADNKEFLIIRENDVMAVID